jgi:hypothetical protein
MDPRNFLLNTDYPMDKIIFVTSGSISVPNNTNDNIVLTAHLLPFIPLCILMWSNTSNFTITNETNDEAFMATTFTSNAGQNYSCDANSTNINIRRYNFSGSTKTVYYRVICFMPSDISSDSIVPFTSSLGANFIVNTDNNYMKLYHEGFLTTINKTYNHNLGYTPRVRVWSNTGSILLPAQEISNDPTGSGGATSGVYITDTQIIWLNPNTFTKLYFRIYIES